MTKRKHKPILSISLLSCGNEPRIEDCLKGLMPLKKELGAEIIVVDTSPNKNGEVRCIIEKYADKVVDFDWCDNFAKARNAGLFECTGNWFMYVDDDEVLENQRDLVSFFTSGEYKNFHVASIIIHDLLDESGGKSFDAWTPRLFEMKKGARFESRVHEHFVPAEYPLKALNTSVRHYGYIFESHEAFIAHVSRNIRLLKIELKDHPNNIPARIHLLQEYVRKHDSSKQLETAHSCLLYLKGLNDRQSRIYSGLCIGIFVRANRIKKQFEDIDILPAVNDDDLPVVQAFLSLEKARFHDEASIFLADTKPKDAQLIHEKGLTEASNYLSIYKKIRSELNLHSDELSFSLAGTFDEGNLKDMDGLLHWKSQIDGFVENATTSEIAARYHDIQQASAHQIKSSIWQYGIRKAYFEATVDAGMLMAWIKDHGNTSPKDLPDIENAYQLYRERLNGFCEKTIDFYGKFNSFIQNRDEQYDIKKRMQLACRLSPLFTTEETESDDISNVKKVLTGIRDAIGICTELDPVLLYYTHLYGEYVKQVGIQKTQKQAEESRKKELKHIIEALQHKVDGFVAIGKLKEAQMLIDEVQKYIP